MTPTPSSAAVGLAKLQDQNGRIEHSTINPATDETLLLCSDARPSKYQFPVPLQPSRQKITTPHVERFHTADALRIFDIACHADAVRDEAIQKYKTHNNGRLERWMAERYKGTTATCSPRYIAMLGYHTDARGRFHDRTAKFSTLLQDGQKYADAEIDDKLKAIQNKRVANRANFLLDWNKRWPDPATVRYIDGTPGTLSFGCNFSSLPRGCYAAVNDLRKIRPRRAQTGSLLNATVVGGTPGYFDYAGAKANRERLIRLREQEASQVDGNGFTLAWGGTMNAYERAGFVTGRKRDRNERRERPKVVKELTLNTASLLVVAETKRPLTNADLLSLPPNERTLILRGTRYREGDYCPVSAYRRTLPRPKGVSVWLSRDRHGKWKIFPEINWKARAQQAETIPVQAGALYILLTVGDRETEVGNDPSYVIHSFKIKRCVSDILYSMIESVVGHMGNDEITIEDISADGVISSESGSATLADSNTAPF